MSSDEEERHSGTRVCLCSHAVPSVWLVSTQGIALELYVTLCILNIRHEITKAAHFFWLRCIC